MSVKSEYFFHDNKIFHLATGLLAGTGIFLLLFLVKPVYVLAISLLPLILVVIFRKPFIVLIICLLFSFFRIHEAYPFMKPMKIILLTSIASLVVLGWQVFLSRNIKPVWTRELIVVFVFAFIVTLGLPYAFNPDIAFEYWQNVYIKIIVMVPAIAWLIRSVNEFNWTNRIMVTGGILIGARAIYNKIYGIGLVEGTRVTIGLPETEDPFGLPVTYSVATKGFNNLLSDPNDLALVLLFPLGYALSLLVYRSGIFNTLLALVSVPVIITGIIVTQSRGGLLGLLTVFGIIGLQRIKSRLVLGVLGSIAFLALFLAMGIGDRASGGFEELAKSGSVIDESSMGRIIAWQAAVNMALNNQLFGVGIYNFVDAFSTYTFTWPGMDKAVHSTWLGVLAETGIPGLFTFVLMILLVLKMAFTDLLKISNNDAPPPLKVTSLAQLSGLVSFCIAGSFLTHGFTFPVYIIIALTLALHQQAIKFRAHKPGH